MTRWARSAAWSAAALRLAYPSLPSASAFSTFATPPSAATAAAPAVRRPWTRRPETALGALPLGLETLGSSVTDLASSMGGAIPPDATAYERLVAVASALSDFLVRVPPPADGLDRDALRESSVLFGTPWHAAAVSAFAIGNAILALVNYPQDYSEAPYEPGTSTYDPDAASEFYSSRPLTVLRRVMKLALLTGAFNAGLIFDWLVLGKLMKDEEYTALRRNEPTRAKEALGLCERLGPTFIKLGQALSIRTDLVPEPYALELRSLQDAVPPFGSEDAYDVLRDELGVSDLGEIFSYLSEEPVASASIGQVYRGTLASDGRDVAVKVQRPGILSEIALDLHVLRVLTPVQTVLQNAANGIETTREDIDAAVLLVDEWGRGFVAETDYRLEALNTETFEYAMRSRGLDAVCAPAVVNDLTRDKVLVTEWVDGTRLDRDESPDVPRLCGVAINAYLTMLLDTGTLHCDPHPGNLLRTADGRLCVLDWGMTLEVPSDLQYSLLEFIAHINIEDYDSIPQDFINLGFSPPGTSADRLKQSGITDGLSFALRQLSAGGGPRKIQERVKAEFQDRYGSDLSDTELRDAARAEMMERMESQLASEGVDVKGVTNVMEEMSRRNRELFALPPYVLYVARAFSTLEGIGLSIDEDYSIVQECYPYLARRLFTDRSPRAKRALRAMLGLAEEGKGEGGVDPLSTSPSSPPSGLAAVRAGTAASSSSSSSSSATSPPSSSPGALSPGKLIEMSDGFASYTAATSDVDRDGAGMAAAVDGIVDLILDPKGSALQDILVDEAARLGDAATRAALRSALVESRVAKAAAAALRAPKSLLGRYEVLSAALPGGIRSALVDNPAAVPDILEALVALDAEDERVLASARELGDALGPRLLGGAGGGGGGTADGGGGTAGGGGGGLRSALADRLGDGASIVPAVPPPRVPLLAARSALTDADARRRAAARRAPGAAALGRRVGAGLLRRAARRARRSEVLPEGARRAIAVANEAIADVVEPAEVGGIDGGGGAVIARAAGTAAVGGYGGGRGRR